MASLTGKAPKDTFGDLLHIANGNAGADGVLRRVDSGSGSTTALSLSTSKARVDGDLEVSGKVDAGQLTGTIANLGVVLEGGGIDIAPGDKMDLEVPYDCELLKIAAFADAPGSMAFDIRRSTFLAFPPVEAGTICPAQKPALVSARAMQDATLTGWTTAFSAGDVLRFSVLSCSGIGRVTLNLRVRKV